MAKDTYIGQYNTQCEAAAVPRTLQWQIVSVKTKGGRILIAANCLKNHCYV